RAGSPPRERLLPPLHLPRAPRPAAPARRAPRRPRLPPGGPPLRAHDRLRRSRGAARRLPGPLRPDPQDQPRGRRPPPPRGPTHPGGGGPPRRDPALARLLSPLRGLTVSETLKQAFPRIYDRLLPPFFDTEAPVEPKATCSACAMCPPDKPVAGVTYFR